MADKKLTAQEKSRLMTSISEFAYECSWQDIPTTEDLVRFRVDELLEPFELGEAYYTEMHDMLVDYAIQLWKPAYSQEDYNKLVSRNKALEEMLAAVKAERDQKAQVIAEGWPRVTEKEKEMLKLLAEDIEENGGYSPLVTALYEADLVPPKVSAWEAIVTLLKRLVDTSSTGPVDTPALSAEALACIRASATLLPFIANNIGMAGDSMVYRKFRQLFAEAARRTQEASDAFHLGFDLEQETEVEVEPEADQPSLVGQTIKAIRPMNAAELATEKWRVNWNVTVLILKNGIRLFASADEAGTGPGALFGILPNGTGFHIFLGMKDTGNMLPRTDKEQSDGA